ASVDRRINADGTASPGHGGAATHRGWEGKGSVAGLRARLVALEHKRPAAAVGGDPDERPYVLLLGHTSPPPKLAVAAEYHLTPRGQHPNAQNKMLMSGLGAWVAFDAFDLVETLLTQPLLIIAGSEAGSLWHSQELYAKAPWPKELFIVEGAGHMDLY